MLNYGIELEYFVVKDKKVVPAYKFTRNLDGNPILGELKTGVHTSITDCVFELFKLIYVEQELLKSKGVEMSLTSQQTVDKEFILALRKDKNYINSKSLDVLDLKSVYGKVTEKVLPRLLYKASLQLNMSDNEKKTTVYLDKHNEAKSVITSYTNVFDYNSIIRGLDKAFEKNIKKAGRIPGVYAIKDGELGKRIEYRSLPNDIEILSLLK